MKSRIVFSSKSPHWSTPKALYDELNLEFNFNYDPCPLGAKKDGTMEWWTGKRAFCNPPYDRAITRFLWCASEADLAVFLLPARTDTKWFHEIILPRAKEIRFIKGRLHFNEHENGAPFPSMIVVFRK